MPEDINGLVASKSRRQQKLIALEVDAATSLGEAILAYLKWLKTTIAFDKIDLPNHIPHPRRFTLMDGGRGVNLLYIETNDGMCLSRVAIRSSDALFHGVILGLQSIPLGRSTYP